MRIQSRRVFKYKSAISEHKPVFQKGNNANSFPHKFYISSFRSALWRYKTPTAPSQDRVHIGPNFLFWDTPKSMSFLWESTIVSKRFLYYVSAILLISYHGYETVQKGVTTKGRSRNIFRLSNRVIHFCHKNRFCISTMQPCQMRLTL